jgi:uncharacterized protein Usg
MEVGMVSRVGVVSEDFRKQVLGYGLTTAQILYRMPDHPSLLQTYVWQNYDLFPKFPALTDFLRFWQEKLVLGHCRAFQADQARGAARRRRRVPPALTLNCRASTAKRNPLRLRALNP